MTDATPERRLRVLALASYPEEAASSRYRIVQYIGPLAARGIDVTFSPFLDARLFAVLYKPGKLIGRLPSLGLRTLARIGALILARRAGVVFVQREAMLFGPPLIEWIAVRVFRRPLILDLDDATWVRYESPVYGRAATFLKWPSKTDRLIRWASAVACGSPNVASYARSLGASATLVPATVDTRVFKPIRRSGRRAPVVGWIGSHGTYAYLERLFPVLARLRREIEFTLLIAGAGRDDIIVPGVETVTRSWSLETEVADFQSLDIGLYPIAEDEWSAGKSGLKAVQYMACGVPFVMSPAGVCATMGIAGETHFAAVSDDDWFDHLRTLLTNENLRQRMGASGRAFAEAHYGLEANADLLAHMIRTVART
ncbi:MAG TPA: glycosyltransferase family 4 protein [Thermoanaerobaculia bacterium]|jgi:glycosyltransferase involved in cell wall biosynthesis|nr:glycosyltransferase family 4 protein [Thermoanaerobaculia bacterium]